LLTAGKQTARRIKIKNNNWQVTILPSAMITYLIFLKLSDQKLSWQLQKQGQVWK